MDVELGFDMVLGFLNLILATLVYIKPPNAAWVIRLGLPTWALIMICSGGIVLFF
jgi:hypothetical protein